MRYIESVFSTVPFTESPRPIPSESVTHALSLRTAGLVYEASADARKALDVETLSVEDQYLFHTRIFGRHATKLALATTRSGALNFDNLAADTQSEVFETLANTYAAAHANEDPETLLQHAPEHALFQHIPNTLVRSWIYETRRNHLRLGDKMKSVAAYINVTPGTFPPKPYHIARIGKNDVILAQAFGRDSITDKELVTIRDMRAQLGDDTAMMQYLDSINFHPGPSNEALADGIAKQLRGSSPVEQAMQWEVTYALYMRHAKLYNQYKNYLHTLWPHSGFYPTHEVKEDSIAVMDRIGLYNAQEFAHPDMMARAIGILEKKGVQPDPLALDIPYDPDSTQPHVRTARAFMTREALARVEHVLRGRVKLF